MWSAVRPRLGTFRRCHRGRLYHRMCTVHKRGGRNTRKKGISASQKTRLKTLSSFPVSAFASTSSPFCIVIRRCPAGPLIGAPSPPRSTQRKCFRPARKDAPRPIADRLFHSVKFSFPSLQIVSPMGIPFRFSFVDRWTFFLFLFYFLFLFFLASL